LFHGESIAIITASDFEDITFELIAQRISFNLLSHSFFKENSTLIIVIDVDGFSGTVDGVGDGELRLGEIITFMMIGHKKYNFLLLY